MANPKTVILKGRPIRKEGLAGNALITPGYLIEWLSAADVLMPHSTSTGAAAKRFAIEDDPQAGEIGTAYASGSRIQYGVFGAGDEVYAFLVANATVARGDFLESNGDGVLVAGTTNPIAQAAEDTTAGASASRIRVEVL